MLFRSIFAWLRARVYLADGLRDSALAMMESAVSMNPNLLPMRHHQVKLQLQSGALDAAEATLDELASLRGDERHRLEIKELRRRLKADRARRLKVKLFQHP